MAADPLSPVGMYGDAQWFRDRLAEGYTTIRVGGGPWVDDEARLVGLFAAEGPGLPVATMETYKFLTLSGHTARSGPTVRTHDLEGWEALKTHFQLDIGPSTPLRALVDALARGSD